jgi:hypothetical protein
VKVLKNAAKTRKVPAEEILSALSFIEKAKVDPSGFLDTLGGKESPGRTWMLIFTAKVNIFLLFRMIHLNYLYQFILTVILC